MIKWRGLQWEKGRKKKKDSLIYQKYYAQCASNYDYSFFNIGLIKSPSFTKWLIFFFFRESKCPFLQKEKFDLFINDKNQNGRYIVRNPSYVYMRYNVKMNVKCTKIAVVIVERAQWHFWWLVIRIKRIAHEAKNLILSDEFSFQNRYGRSA